MKRHPAFQDLSRDHFVALNAVVDVRRVVEGDRFSKGLGPVWDAFLELAYDVLPDHFVEEERLLLPHLQDPERQDHARRLEADHARLRHSFLKLAVATPDAQALWNLAEDLRLHVRWEEDELFERMQMWLSDEELAELARRDEAFRKEAGMPLGAGH